MAFKSCCSFAVTPPWLPGKGFSYIEMTVPEDANERQQLLKFGYGLTIMTQYQPSPCPCPLWLISDMLG